MKPLKLAIPALILATAGAAGAQSVTADGGVTADTGVTAGGAVGVDAEVTAEAGAGAENAQDGLTVAAENAAEAGLEASLRLTEGTTIRARDGVAVGSVAGIVDKAKGLVRVELDEALEAELPAVVLSAETLTAVDGEIQVPMTGAEFSAALAQLAETEANATN